MGLQDDFKKAFLHCCAAGSLHINGSTLSKGEVLFALLILEDL